MPIKVNGRNIKFLKSRKPISRNDGIDENHKYIIEMKDPDKITDDYKIPILSDCFFKTMFMNENRKKYSCLLLSYLLNIPYEKLLTKLEFGKNELDKRKNSSKGERADFIAYIYGAAIDIEINCNDKIETLERNIEYMDRLYSKEVKRGEKYYYRQSILVNINNFAFKGKNEVKYICYITDNDNEAITDKKIIIQIYIPNLIKKWYTNGVENLSEEEKYLLTLVVPDVRVASEIGKGNEIMEEYINEAIEVSRDEEFRDEYRKEWELRDQGFRDGYDDGYDSGYESGKTEGYESGKTEGYESGKTDGKNEGIIETKIEMIKKMLLEKVDIDLIMKITGLSKEEIETYQNE